MDTNALNFDQTLQSGLAQNALMHRVTKQIYQSLDLSEILTTTVNEICSFLTADRVVIYQFHEDGSGQVIAEALMSSQLTPLLHLKFPADDIPPHARDLFLNYGQRSIVDVPSQQIGLSAFNAHEHSHISDRIQIEYRPADPCHLKYLSAMGVATSLAVPLLYRQLQAQNPEPKLWGLLVVHYCQSHAIAKRDLQLVQQVVDQVASAIAQATLFNQVRDRAEQEAAINRIAGLLQILPNMQLQVALREIVQLVQGSGGRLYLSLPGKEPELYTIGVQPSTFEDASDRNLEAQPLWQHWLQAHSQAHQAIASQAYSSSEPPIALDDLYQDSNFQALSSAFHNTKIRSLLVMTLHYGPQPLGYLTLFRDETSTETIWAGQFNSQEQQLQPRQSFIPWREYKHHQPVPWSAKDINLAKVLGQQCASAIHQYHLYQQVQQLNLNLEAQVQERTAQLEQALESARAFKEISHQIRGTLDLPVILQTVVREVQELLDSDRVVIYQFTHNWTGTVVVEEVKGHWPPLLGQTFPDECFPNQYAQLYQQGRIRVVDDVAHSELHPCHIEFLLKIHVQANLVVPIRRGETLWGLLISHACSEPRVWQGFEIDLVQQLADQAAIAIQQAELYGQKSQAALRAIAQTKELEATLAKLQQAQTQLIQTEKMSSLGQLVAGIAHEINNPINFINGNIQPAQNYIHELLELVQLYQLEVRQPSEQLQAYIAKIDLDFLQEDLVKILGSMRVGADRIRQIVLSLRNFSRLDEAEMKPVNIHDGIESTLLLLQNRLKAKPHHPNITVVKEYGDLPQVECYAGQLNQVLMNLLTNAIDALEDRDSQQSPQEIDQHPSTIRIRTEFLNNDHIRIRIADNGPGVPPSLQRRLFDPFFTTKPVGKGTGLGLSISYQIVTEKHGGLLHCLAEPDQGTEFVIEIPIFQA